MAWTEYTNSTQIYTNSPQIIKVEEQTPSKRFRPFGDRVLVRVNPEAAEPVINGIVRPDVTVEKPFEGEVVEVGNGKLVNGERIPIDVKKGQVIVFGRYSGNEIEVGGEKLLILQEQEIPGVYEE